MTNVIIHASDSSWGNAAIITKWHILPPPEGRGWSTIGYHYVILNGRLSAFKRHSYFDGHIETGRPLDDDADLEFDEKGAAAKGFNDAVQICLIGLSGTFTEGELRALSSLIHRLRNQFGEINVMQHSDVDPVNKSHCAGLSKLQINVLNNL
jgi:hypothetical protein